MATYTNLEEYISKEGKEYKNYKDNYEFLSISSLRLFIEYFLQDNDYKSGIQDGYLSAMIDYKEEIAALKEECRQLHNQLFEMENKI